MKNLKESLNGLGWLDLIFLIPLFFLYTYLPAYNLISVLLNVIIIILVSIGLSFISLSIRNFIKNKDWKQWFYTNVSKIKNFLTDYQLHFFIEIASFNEHL
jgi:hypothetical protein